MTTAGIVPSNPIGAGYSKQYASNKLVGQRESYLTNIIVGIVGAVIGGFGYAELTGVPFITRFNLGTLVVAVLGAVIVLAVVGALTRNR